MKGHPNIQVSHNHVLQSDGRCFGFELQDISSNARCSILSGTHFTSGCPFPRLFASIVRLVHQTLKLHFHGKSVAVRTFLGQEPLVCSLLQGPLHSVCFISRFPGNSAQVTLKWDISLELSSPIGLVSHNGIFYRGQGKREEEDGVSHTSLFIFWICQCEQSLYSCRESRGGDSSSTPQSLAVFRLLLSSASLAFTTPSEGRGQESASRLVVSTPLLLREDLPLLQPLASEVRAHCAAAGAPFSQ